MDEQKIVKWETKNAISCLSNAIDNFKHNNKHDVDSELYVADNNCQFLDNFVGNLYHIDIDVLSGKVTLLHMDLPKIKFNEFHKRDVNLINKLIKYGNLNRDDIIVATGMTTFKNNQIK